MYYGHGLAGFLRTQGGHRAAFAPFIYDPEGRRSARTCKGSGASLDNASAADIIRGHPQGSEDGMEQIRTEYVMTVALKVTEAISDLGPTPYGHRRIARFIQA